MYFEGIDQTGWHQRFVITLVLKRDRFLKLCLKLRFMESKSIYSTVTHRQWALGRLGSFFWLSSTSIRRLPTHNKVWLAIGTKTYCFCISSQYINKVSTDTRFLGRVESCYASILASGYLKHTYTQLTLWSSTDDLLRTCRTVHIQQQTEIELIKCHLNPCLQKWCLSDNVQIQDWRHGDFIIGANGKK